VDLVEVRVGPADQEADRGNLDRGNRADLVAPDLVVPDLVDRRPDRDRNRSENKGFAQAAKSNGKLELRRSGLPFP
jgi:hypothetical protein